MRIGKGLSNITLARRLKYEFVREFLPYIEVALNKSYEI